MYLLMRHAEAQDAICDLLRNGALRIASRIDEHIRPLRKLLQKYRGTSISLVDACIVRMSEIHDRHSVLTLDSDFLICRRHGRAPLALIHPAAK
jgi:hypothetical protein